MSQGAGRIRKTTKFKSNPNADQIRPESDMINLARIRKPQTHNQVPKRRINSGPTQTYQPKLNNRRAGASDLPESPN